MMETIIWLGIAAAFAAAVQAVAPYHQRLIERRDIPLDDG
jgi:hypothetical protein